MEVRGVVRALQHAGRRRARTALRDLGEQCREAGWQREDDGGVDLLGDCESRRRLLPRLTAIAGARHLSAGEVASLAAGHLFNGGTGDRGAHRRVAGEQRRQQNSRAQMLEASHQPLW